MKRSAIPKRAISVMVALALVASCLLTSYAGTILSFQGDNNSGECDVKVTTNGGEVVWVVGDDGGDFDNSYIGTLALGTKCKFTANDTNTRKFLYWQDEYDARVYSYERTVEFEAASRMHLRAVYSKSSSTSHVITWVNYGGTVLQKDTYRIGATLTPPGDTKLPGFVFLGWSTSAADATNDPSDQIIYPRYRVEASGFTVAITNDSGVSGAGSYTNFQTVNVKAEPKNGSGETFSYWQDADGNVVSYENNYSFRINYDVTLTAVYGEEVTPEPVIRITKIVRDMSSMKLTFYAERSVPETYAVVSHGMLMSSSSTVSDQQMIVDNAGDATTATVRKAYGTSNELSGTFSLAKAKVSAATVVTARPFIIVKNASGEQFVVYGDIVRTSNNATD